MIDYTEAKDEAAQLTRNLGRSVKVRAINCDCDYHSNCGLCAGEGRYFELVFESCGHSVELETCEAAECAKREIEAVFPVTHPQLKSLTEAQSESEAAA